MKTALISLSDKVTGPGKTTVACYKIHTFQLAVSKNQYVTLFFYPHIPLSLPFN